MNQEQLKFTDKQILEEYLVVDGQARLEAFRRMNSARRERTETIKTASRNGPIAYPFREQLPTVMVDIVQQSPK